MERSHYDLVLSALAVRNVAKLSLPVLPKPANGRTDWEILYELGMRLGGMRLGPKALDAAARLAWRAGLTPDADALLDLALRVGPYRLSRKALRDAPHGLDLGPLQPCREARVRTSDGRVDLLPDLVRDDLPRVARWVDAARDAGALTLIGRRHVRSNNSWMHNCPSLVKGRDRATLRVHPDDAARLGLAEGDRARIESDTGVVTAAVELSDEVMPGVVSLPHGFGQAEARDTLRVAGALDAPNANLLNSVAALDPLSGTAALNSAAVRVTRASA
ncbi:MAG: molybdopterin dinucleotide binding domain-containing protein [Polyangiales bacterium]